MSRNSELGKVPPAAVYGLEEEEEAGFGRLEPAATAGVMLAGKAKLELHFFFFCLHPPSGLHQVLVYGWNLAVNPAGLIWAAECAGPGNTKEQNIESKFGWQVNNLQSILCVPIASRHFLF